MQHTNIVVGVSRDKRGPIKVKCGKTVVLEVAAYYLIRNRRVVRESLKGKRGPIKFKR